MSISFQARLSIPSDVLMRDLQGEAVLLNLNNEHYYGLDAVGTRMWIVLTTRDTLQAAFEQILTEYDVAGDVLRPDLEQFVDSLLQQGLLETVAD